MPLPKRFWGLLLPGLLVPALGGAVPEEVPGSMEELMELRVITAGKTAERVRDVPASVVVITRDEIDRYGWRTLTEVLESVPGLFFMDDYSAEGASFGVRGFWSGATNHHLAFLVNGVRQVWDYSGGYGPSYFYLPVDSIDRIEVVRGPMSVFYGSGAFFGAINIITNQHGKSKVSAGIGGGRVWRLVDDHSRVQTFCRLDQREGDWSYVLNLGQESSDGPDIAIQDLTRDPSSLAPYGIDPERYRTGGRLGARMRNLQFSGSFGSLSVDLSHIESKSKPMFLLPSPGDGTLVKTVSTLFSGTYRHAWSEKLRLEAKAAYSRTSEDADFDYLAGDFYGVESAKSSTHELELILFAAPHPRVELTSGLSQRTVASTTDEYNLPSFGTPSLVNNSFYLVGGDSIVTRAFYSQATVNLASPLKIVGGFRLEQTPKYRIGWDMAAGTPDAVHQEGAYEHTKVEFLPRLAVVWALSEQHVLKAMYGEAIQVPCFFQNTKNVFDAGHALQPEKIRTWECNYAYYSPKVNMGMSVFLNQMESLITRIVELDTNGDFQSWNGNAGRMETLGTELTAEFKPAPGMDTQLSVTYQSTQDKRSGYESIEPAYSPKLLAYGRCSWKIQDLVMALDGHYRGPMESFWDETRPAPTGGFGGRIGDRVPGVFTLGAQLRAENLFGRGISLQLRIANALGREVRYPTFTPNAWADKGTVGEGRSFFLGLSWPF